MIDYVTRNIEMARDASIENYRVRFICYDRTFNKNIMFTYDVNFNDNSKYINHDDNRPNVFITTSKRRFDFECKKLDNDLNRNTEDNDCKEGQDN